jgi:hypothetical protein
MRRHLLPDAEATRAVAISTVLQEPARSPQLLTHLREGQRAVVLQLPAQAKKAEAEHPLLPEARCALDWLHDPQAG